MQTTPEYLDVKAVATLIGGSKPINKATIYRRVRAGTLPKPVKLSVRLVRWVKATLLEWLHRAAA